MRYEDYILALGCGNLGLKDGILKSDELIHPQFPIFKHSYFTNIFDIAIEQGNIDLIKEFYTNYTIEWSAEGPGGITPLMRACKNRNIEIIKYFLCVEPLLTKIFTIDQKDNFGNNALHYAVEAGSLEIIKILIEYNASSVNSKGENILTVAASYGHLDIVQYLAEEKKLNIQTQTLILAIEGRHFSIVQFLLDHEEKLLNNEADLSERSIKSPKKESNLLKSLNKEGMSILEISARLGDYLIFKYLFDKTIITNKKILVEKYTKILLTGISSAKTPLIKFILQKGSEIFEDFYFYESTTEALATTIKNGNLEILKLLVRKYGANVNSLINDKLPFDIKLSLLEFATKYNQLHIVKYLIEDEPRVKYLTQEEQENLTEEEARELEKENFKNNCNNALLLACREGNINIVEYLIKTAGADCNFGDNTSPLITAISNGKFEVVKYLVEDCNVDIFKKCLLGENAFHIAISLEHDMNPELYFDFLARKLPYKRIGLSKETLDFVLFYIAVKNKLSLLKFLVENLNLDKNDLKGLDFHGEDIFRIAIKSGHSDIVDYLLQKGYFRIDDLESEDFISIMKIVIRKGNLGVINDVANDSSINEYDKKNLFEALVSDILNQIPLIESSFNAFTKILSYGLVNINHLIDFDLSALSVAIQKGHSNIVKYIIENCETLILEREDERNDPIILSIKHNRFEILKYLRNKVSLEYLQKLRENTNLYYFACKYSSSEIVSYIGELLPEFTENTNSPDMTILSPMDMAIKGKNHLVIKYFSTKEDLLPRAIMRIVLEIIENNKYDRVHLSSLRDLLSKKTNITEFRDNEGNTPLILALKHNKIFIAEILIESEADVEATNMSYETPLALLLSLYNNNSDNPQDPQSIIELVKDLVINKHVPIPANSYANPIWRTCSEFEYISRGFESFDQGIQEDIDMGEASFSSIDEPNPSVDIASLEEMDKIWGEVIDLDANLGWRS